VLTSLPGAPQQQPKPAAPPVQAPAQPQQQVNPDQPSTRISVSVSDVIVPVTVTDDKGRYVSNLTVQDFRVVDEGRPQRIKSFAHREKQPVVVGFLVDLSNNSRIHWAKYQEAIKELMFNLIPGEPHFGGYLIGYATNAELLVNTTSDSQTLMDKIDKIKPGGGAALFDALYKACTMRSLIKGEPYEPRRVIVIIGDGHNSSGDKTLEEVLELAKRNQITIFGMSTKSFGFISEEGSVLERLATETGGHVEYPLDNPYKDVSGYLSNPQDAGNYSMTVGTGAYAAQIAAGILKSVANISGEVTTQYVLVYTPDLDQDVKPKVFRKIKVEVPKLPNVKISARDGYYPNPVSGNTPSGGGQ
jgi:Ca-activated chloride channel homolog